MMTADESVDVVIAPLLEIDGAKERSKLSHTSVWVSIHKRLNCRCDIRLVRLRSLAREFARKFLVDNHREGRFRQMYERGTALVVSMLTKRNVKLSCQVRAKQPSAQSV